MEIIFLLIPLSLLLVAAALWGFFWAARNGQFDDLNTPALMILEDDHKEPVPNEVRTEDGKKADEALPRQKLALKSNSDQHSQPQQSVNDGNLSGGAE